MRKQSNFYLKDYELTTTQTEVLLGGLLGDASLSKGGKHTFPRMSITRQALDAAYLQWQFKVFKNLCAMEEIKHFERYDVRYNVTRPYVFLRTRAVPAFNSFYEQWYGSGTRQVPHNLILTPLICAVWFFDDGSFIQEKNKKAIGIKFSTNSFDVEGTRFLAEQLSDILKSKFSIYQRKPKNQWIIKTASEAAVKFIQYIEPCVSEMGMERKTNLWKNLNFQNFRFKNGKLL